MSIGKRQLGGQYYINNQVSSISLGLWINYQIPVGANSFNTNYTLFYMSSDTTDSTSNINYFILGSEINLRLLTVFISETQQNQNIQTTIILSSFQNYLVLTIPQSLQNQWIYFACTLNLAKNMLELGLIYTNTSNSQTISNTYSSFSSTINLSTMPNIGLFPLWTPISSLLCGQVYNFFFFTQSSFYQNVNQLIQLSQISESQLVGNYLLMQSSQLLSQINQNLVDNQVIMISGYSQEVELQNDVQFSQIQNLKSTFYYPVLSDQRFFTIKNLDIENSMTLIFDYYTQLSVNDIIFASQSLTSSNLKMFAVSQLLNATGLYLNVTIEGNDIIFSTQLVQQQNINIGLSIRCLPPFYQTIINLSVNYANYEQKSIQGVCFNMKKTNQKIFLGYFEAISQNSNQFKSVYNLMIVKGMNVSGIYSQSELLSNYRQIENCQYILQSAQSNLIKCLRCGGQYLLYNNECIKSQDCQIIDQISKQPQLSSSIIGNTCFLDCQNSQIIKPNTLCDYDYLALNDFSYGTLNLTSQNSSQIIQNLSYSNNPQIFLGISGIQHDGATQGYNFTLTANNVQPTQFQINLNEFTNKTYSSFLVSYFTAPQNSSRVEIGSFTLNSSYMISQPDKTIQVYQFPFTQQKYYIPNVVVSVSSYLGLSNQIKLNYTVQNITYSSFQLQVPIYNDTNITNIQYLAFKGQLFEQKFNFSQNNLNGWGSQPQNSTFRYLNTLNQTLIQRVDPNIKLFSIISGMVKTNDTYQGLSVLNVNNTINYGKLVVDYVQANKSALFHFKSSSILIYNTCKVSACLYSDFDNNNMIGYDQSLLQNLNHPLQSGTGLRQYISRIQFNKFFIGIPQVFLYFEEINVPEASQNTGISFEFRPQNINYDGFDLVYEVYNSFLLKGMRIKYFATQNQNIQIGSVIVSQSQLQQFLSIQNNSSASQFYPISSTFQNQFSQTPQVMVSVYSYSGDLTANFNFNIQILSVNLTSVTFNIQINPGNLTQFKFQYIAVQYSSLIEIQNLNPANFNNSPIAVSYDPVITVQSQTIQNSTLNTTNNQNTTQTNQNSTQTSSNSTLTSSNTSTNTTSQNTKSRRRFIQTNSGQSSSNSTSSSNNTTTTTNSTKTTTNSTSSTNTTTNTNSTPNQNTTTTTNQTTQNNAQTIVNIPETVIYNNWLTKYWDRWNVTSFNNVSSISYYSTSAQILYPIYQLQVGSQSLTDVDFQTKGSIQQLNGQFYYSAYLNVEREFIQSLGISMMGSLLSCPSWCNKCDQYGGCLQCKDSNKQIPNCTQCQQGYILDPVNGCVQCLNGCCKSNPSSTLCDSCTDQSLYQQLNCGCYTNQQVLYIAWKNKIQLNVTLINGGDMDSFNLLGCSTCSMVKTNRTIIVTQNSLSLNNFAIYSSIGNSLGTIEYEVSMQTPPQFICFGSLKQEKTFMVGLQSSQNSKFNFDHLQNSMSYCSDRTTNQQDGQILQFTPLSLNWQNTYSLKYQNNTFMLSDKTQQINFFSIQFYLSYNITVMDGSYPSYNIRCEGYKLAKLGSYQNIKPGLNSEVLKNQSISNQQVYPVNFFKDSKQTHEARINLVVQAWFYINSMQDKVVYSLFEVFSQDQRAQIGVSCTSNSILLNYQNMGDSVYQKNNFPIITGLDNLSNQWFYLSLDWVNNYFQSNFTVKLIKQKGFWSSNITVYSENTAQFDFSSQLNFTVNNPVYFVGSQWNGQTMDFGFYNFLNTQPNPQNTMTISSLNLNDSALYFQKTYSKIVFFYEFKIYNSTSFIYDYSNNNNNFMDPSYQNALTKQGLLVQTNQSFTIPNSFYLGQINEEYGFVIGFTITINKVSPFEGTLLQVGQLNFKLILQDGSSNSQYFPNFQQFYTFQICAYQVQCVNSQKIQIPINSSSSYGISIQIMKIYYGNQRVLTVSFYSQNFNEENIIFNLPSATTGFNSFSQTSSSAGNLSYIIIGAQNNEFNNPQNYFVIGRLVLQSGSYVKPYNILLQSQTDEAILQIASNSLGITLQPSDQANSIMLNRLSSQNCILQLGKYNSDQLCIKCNTNFQNVFGVCISNGECNTYQQQLVYQQQIQQGAYYFDYNAKQCLPCNLNCKSCQYFASNCLTCSNGFQIPPLCNQCVYNNGNPTFYNPDSQSCVSQCPSNYCTDIKNLLCTKCDGIIRNMFQDFYTPQQFQGYNWIITKQINQNSQPKFINCFINQYQLLFFGGAGTLNGSSMLSTSITQIPLHYKISYSFVLLVSKAGFTVNASTIQNYLQLFSDGNLVTNYQFQVIQQNSMICSNQLPQSSVYFINATFAHQNTATQFNISFNFASNPSQSSQLNWGVRSFNIDILQCHYSCFTCSGPNVSDCLSCTSDLIFVNGRCLCPLKSQQLVKQFNCWSNPCYSCQTCNMPCQTCDNDNICIQCMNGYFLYEGICYQDCSKVPQNLRYWPYLMNDLAKRLCLPTNLTQQIQIFSNNTLLNEFQYSKFWVQSPVQTPGQYLLQCGSNNFVGQFSNTNFSRIFNLTQPYFQLSIQFSILILNPWLKNSQFNVQINNSSLISQGYSNLQQITSINQCLSYSSPQLAQIQITNYTYNQPSFQLSLYTSNFNSVNWALRNLTIIASLCPIYCSQCNSQTQCTQCVNGGNPQYQCQCNSGYVYSLQPKCSVQPCGYCLPCDQSCSLCSGPGPFNCIQCKLGYKQLGQRCVLNCPDNYYYNTNSNQCLLCHSSCYNCLGPSIDNCISCYAPQVLQDNKCVNSCTQQNEYLDSFSQACLIQSNPISLIFLNNTSTFSNDIFKLYSTSNPSQANLYSQCGSNLFAGPFNSQVILQIPQIYIHSQLILQLDILVLQSTTLSFSSNFSFLNNVFQQQINLAQKQTCSSSTSAQFQTVIAYISSFSAYFSQNLQITISSQSQIFYIKNMNLTSIVCHKSCQTCKGPLQTDCLSCTNGAALQPNNSCSCIDQSQTLMFIQGSFSSPFTSYCSQCQYPCTTCFQANNFSCRSCQQGFYLKDYSCVTSCPPLKYQQLSNLGICKPCPFPCDECTPDGQSCLTCQQGYVLTMARQCQLTCWEQQYIDQNNVCQSCDISCQSCNGPNNTNCTQCNLGYFLETQSGACLPCNSLCLQCTDQTNLSCSLCQYGVIFYNNSICTLDCSEIPGTYAQDDSCLPCNSQCKTCDGPDFSDCLQCQDGFTLLNNICVPCDSTCLRCFGTTSDQCYSCVDGYVLQGNSCVLSCNPGYFLQTKICNQCNQACRLCFGPQNNQCTSCSQGFYFNNNICLPCHPYCQNCFGPNQDNCLFCNPGSFLLRTQCYSNQQGGCPQGYYGNFQTGLCSLCDPSCLTCQGSSPNVCLSCPKGSYMTQLYYDISGIALPSSCSPCPSVCQICSSATTCILCQTNYFLYQNTCLSTCPYGFYGSYVTGMCTPCSNNCTTCSGFNSLGNFICNSCTVGYYLDSNSLCSQCSTGCVLCKSQNACIQCQQGQYNYQGYCLKNCPVGYYPSDSTQSCVQCVKPCSLCTSSTMCQACQVGYYLQNNYNQSKVLVSSSCMICNNVCNDCSAGTALDCISCKSPLSLQGNQCQQQCNVGYYSNQGMCLLCSQNCLQCTSASNCTVCSQGYISIKGVCQLCNFKCSSCFGLNETQCYSCISPYYLYQSTCQLTCPDQFFKQTITDSSNVQQNICQKCNSSCFNCFGTGDNQCKSCINGYFVTSQNTCSQCSQLCGTCSQSSTLCTSCPLGQFLSNQTCVQTCPPGFYGSDQDNQCHQCNSPCSTCTGSGINQCTSCLKSYFYSSGQCLPCHPNCSSCYGFQSNECYTCQLGMQQQGNTCTSCGDGNYYDSLLNSCQQCNPVCQTCYGASSSNCLSCQSGKYLYQSTCNICPSSCSSCQSQTMCTSCANSFSLLTLSFSNQICVQDCPQGMIVNSFQQCQCSNNCNLCTIDPASLLVSCTKCSAQNYVIDLFTKGNQFACIDSSTCQGFIDIQSNSCVQSCSSTTPFVDFVAKQCIQNSCPQNTVILYVSGQGQCLSTCPKGYYANSQQICSPCHPLCSICTGPQPDQCQGCVQNILYHPVISTCSDSCLIGYNIDTVSGYCVVCYNFCKACISNLVLFNGLCLEECPVGYTQTASMTCVESSNEVVKILNSFNSAIGITKDVVLQASLFVLGPVKSIEWVLKKCTDAQFQASFDLLTINTLTLTIPFLVLKSSQSYTFRIEVILASNEILNDEISFMTAGEIIAGSFIVNPSSGIAGSDIFQFSIQNYKFPLPLLFDISYFVLQVQYSNTIADDGSIVKQTNPSFVKVGLVQIYEQIPFNQTQSSLLTYQFPIYYESDQNIACEIKIYSSDGSVERYDYSIITLKKTVKVDQSIFKFNSQNVFDQISFLNYILNIRESFVIDSKKLAALQQNNNINMQIALSNKKTYNQNAQCDSDIDCFGQGSCVMQLNLYSCQCLDGYLGVNCQWQQSDYIFLQANIPQYIQYILSSNTTKYSNIIVAQAIGNVFYYSDFNNQAIQLADAFISLLNASLKTALDQIQIQIYQTICQNLITILQNTQAQQASTQIQQLQTLNSNIQSATWQNINMGESLTQQSSTSDSAAIPLSLSMVSTSNSTVSGTTPQGRRQRRRLQKLQKIRLLQSSSDSNQSIPVVFRSLTVQIPPDVIDTSKKVIVSGSSFKVDPRANPFAVTTTLSLSLGGSGGAQNVSDAPKPIVMTIPKKVPSPPGINTDALQCTYYDEETNSYKSDGCTLVKETITSIICSCTHLTDFSAALQPQQIKSSINLSDMKAAQNVGNALLSASTPAVITIANLPTPKIGQRNVNLVNAVNIQLSGGILNVLAKQTYIVVQDGENYSTYSMWDYIQQDSVLNLISNQTNTDSSTVSQSSNTQLGQLIIIGVIVVGVFLKTGIRASFKFQFLDDDEAPAEIILNNIHKNIKNKNEQNEQDNNQEKNIKFQQEQDKEYDFSITQSHNMNSNFIKYQILNMIFYHFQKIRIKKQSEFSKRICQNFNIG
ncbi:hypothetical protein ABPG74_014214 [Tetrahymena malaccensis]